MVIFKKGSNKFGYLTLFFIFVFMEYKLIENENTGVVVYQRTIKEFEMLTPDGKPFLVQIIDSWDTWEFTTDLTGKWEKVEEPSDLYDFINENLYGVW
jgi:hypothetical protein